MNKGMAMVAIDELKKVREEVIMFAQESDIAIVMLIGNTLGDRDDSDVIEAVKYLKSHNVKYHNACARVDKAMNIVRSETCYHKDAEKVVSV